MYEMLFHPAFWMPLLVVVVGIVVFVVGNNRVHVLTRRAGVGVAMVGVLWFVVAFFIQTPVEQAVTRTKQIVAATETADWPKLQTLLDRDTILEMYRGPKPISDAVDRAASGYGLKSVRVFSTDALVTQPDDEISVTINALLDGAQPTTAKFEFVYARRSDGLLLTRINPLEVGGHNLDEIRRVFH